MNDITKTLPSHFIHGSLNNDLQLGLTNSSQPVPVYKTHKTRLLQNDFLLDTPNALVVDALSP